MRMSLVCAVDKGNENKQDTIAGNKGLFLLATSTLEFLKLKSNCIILIFQTGSMH